MKFQEWRFWDNGRVLTPRGRITVLFLALFFSGFAFASCAALEGLTGGDISETICTTPVAQFVAAACPTLTGGDWRAQETCRHAALSAYHLKMAACIGDGVLTE